MLSVIIPTKDRADYLERLFQALCRQTLGKSYFEIIIIDNGSSDNTKEVIVKWQNRFENLRYFFEKSPGLHTGRHKGFREAKGNILVYADDDIEPFETWLEAIQKAFENPEIVLVGGKCLPKFESNPPQWLKQLWEPDEKGERNLSYLSLIDLGDRVKNTSPYNIFGCNFSIRKEILTKTQGFHPDSFPQQFIRYRGDGETYVSRYIEKHFLKVLYHPRASVYHWVPEKRLTKEYFCQRAFNQGISDSFTKIRQAYLREEYPHRSIPDIIAKATTSPDAVTKFFRRKGQALLSKLKSKKQTTTQSIEKDIENSYWFGYKYHQDEVMGNPVLLSWVLKINYWEGSIPE